MKVFKTFYHVEMKPTDVSLTSYSGQHLDVAGKIELVCYHYGKATKLPFVMVRTNHVES